MKYVIDTTSIISYFSGIFNQKSQISEKALNIIESALCNTEIKLVIPCIVLIEIYTKFFINEEQNKKIRYEVFERLKSKDNIHFNPLEKEVLENFIKITYVYDKNLIYFITN